MKDSLIALSRDALFSLRDLLPIIVVIGLFQAFVIRQPVTGLVTLLFGAMLERAVAAHPRFCVNPLEIERGGPSYSVDSLQAIQGRTDSSLALILGSDAFNGFPRWKDPEQILEIAHLVVCHRPGAPLDADLYAERRVMSAAELSQQPSGLILVLEIEANHCASSELRRQIAAGESTDDCLSAGVADYIRQHHLYRQVEVET